LTKVNAADRLRAAMAPAQAMALLEARNLAFRAGERTILAGIDLAVREREIHALLGANGTGKTTLARVIMGCAGYAASAGEARFLDHDLAPLAMHERARLGLAISWQEPARFEGISVGEFIALGASDADPAGCLDRVGLAPDEYLGRALDRRLSGGERKRIELASVLALRPKLAILDEPAAGIDLASLEEITEVILGLKRAGSSVLLITHVESVARAADRASYLCGGRIVFTGDPALAAERYRTRRCTICDGEVCAR
jgi:Fe-S cluster assembly ATP-binding protein